MIEALGDYIFNNANKTIAYLEGNEKLKEVATEFNELSDLKRRFDFYIINFWLASVACELYYEQDDFQKICEGIEEGIIESIESYGKSNLMLGVTLKEFVKDKEELFQLCQEYSVGAETVIGFRALLAVLIPKRFSDYHSTLSIEPNFKWESVAMHFGKHIFGKKITDSPSYMLGLGPAFAIILSSTLNSFSEYIIEVERRIELGGIDE